MGKRRIRCLSSLGVSEISAYDTRTDRINEAKSIWPDLRCYESFEVVLQHQVYDAWIISVPPSMHVHYMRLAVQHRTPFFVEASVTDEGLSEVISGVKEAGILAAPSRTLCYHPAIKAIKSIVANRELGKISNIIYHSGQYLPDWHSYEHVADYYVSEPTTGGCREILPFELTWFTDIFGFPVKVAGNYRRTITIAGAERIDDTYNCLLDYADHLAIITVDVVSRYARRRLIINGSEKQLEWDWDQNSIRIYDPGKNAWTSLNYSIVPAAPGYNANIGEGMYVDEIRDFLGAVRGDAPYPGTLTMDHRILRLLYQIEESDQTSRFIQI
jgi:predicted dehydrogenase